jgi:hypothetical protein
MSESFVLNRRQRASYLMEIQQILGTLSRRLDELEHASEGWALRDDSLDGQLEDESKVDMDTFVATLEAQGRDQVVFFDSLEAFLAAWSRLSLLIFPDAGSGDTASEFRIKRGEALRHVLGIESEVSSRIAACEMLGCTSMNGWIERFSRGRSAATKGSSAPKEPGSISITVCC